MWQSYCHSFHLCLVSIINLINMYINEVAGVAQSDKLKISIWRFCMKYF